MHLIIEISLNISFALYLILYLPQLIHNIVYKRLKEMSLGFHALLLMAASADLFYAFGRIEQWQYRTVSLLMIGCLLIQHMHLYYHYQSSRKETYCLHGISLIVVMMTIALLHCMHHPNAHGRLFIIMGWVERIGYWLYAVPQLMLNKKLGKAGAISPLFLCMTLLTAIFDTIAAWGFHWGSPSLYGTPVAIALHIVLLYQWYRAHRLAHTVYTFA